MSNYKVKQVIVMRTKFPDGKGGFVTPRKGKLIAQACHASISFISKRIRDGETIELNKLTKEEQEWFSGSFAKICVYVETEEELINIYNLAIKNNLNVHLITDSGVTEFSGIPTKTCLAIGPHNSSKFEGITSSLKLL